MSPKRSRRHSDPEPWLARHGWLVSGLSLVVILLCVGLVVGKSRADRSTSAAATQASAPSSPVTNAPPTSQPTTVPAADVAERHRTTGRFVAAHSPTGNINCAWVAMPAAKFVACQTQNNGHVVVLPSNSRGFRPAKSIELPPGRELHYGQSKTAYGITCTSRISGFTCTNAHHDAILVNRTSEQVLIHSRAAFIGFQSPTGNIRCIYLDGSPTSFVACQTENNHATVALAADGTAFRVADRHVFPANGTVAYGSTWNRPGLECSSKFEGMSCQNLFGDAFAINRSGIGVQNPSTTVYVPPSTVLPALTSPDYSTGSYWAAPPPAYTPPSYVPPAYSAPTYNPPPDTYSGSYPPGGYNAAGCPRDEWTNGYWKPSSGTWVSGYFHNSPTDGCGGG